MAVLHTEGTACFHPEEHARTVRLMGLLSFTWQQAVEIQMRKESCKLFTTVLLRFNRFLYLQLCSGESPPC